MAETALYRVSDNIKTSHLSEVLIEVLRASFEGESDGALKSHITSAYEDGRLSREQATVLIRSFGLAAA
jgi:hypothetical protein